MKTMHNVLLLCLACLAFSACAKTNSSGGSSETHFLALCNASCEDGYSCLCGVCTESCDDDAACEALSGEASCQVSADGCGTPMVCDVGCSDDDDCATLGASHECQAGRCRAPAEDMMSGDGDGDGDSGSGGGGGGPGDGGSPYDLSACTIEAAVEYLSNGDSPSECEWAGPISAADRAQCVREQRDNGDPFVITWEIQGIDSILKTGFVGVPDGTDYTVYKLYYDSIGSLGRIDPNALWITQWTKCKSFTINEECDAIDDCFVCEEDSAQECGCQFSTPREVECTGYAIVPPSECESPSCNIDGVCYPSGAGTEDGCCSCYDGDYTCIEPGWCPGWATIGKRCGRDEVCGGGLECRDDIKGGMPVCTRTCNFGCPTGYECVTNVPDMNDEPISEGLCLKPCESHGDCEVSGVSLESLCVGVDAEAGPFYCL
jgi:hypothetical protein